MYIRCNICITNTIYIYVYILYILCNQYSKYLVFVMNHVDKGEKKKKIIIYNLRIWIFVRIGIHFFCFYYFLLIFLYMIVFFFFFLLPHYSLLLLILCLSFSFDLSNFLYVAMFVIIFIFNFFAC